MAARIRTALARVGRLAPRGAGSGVRQAGTTVTFEMTRMLTTIALERRDLGTAIEELKRAPGKALFVGGVKLALALTELGLIDEYELVVHPRLAGHGPTLFAGLSKPVDLKLVSRLEYGSGAVAMRYEPRRGQIG